MHTHKHTHTQTHTHTRNVEYTCESTHTFRDSHYLSFQKASTYLNHCNQRPPPLVVEVLDLESEYVCRLHPVVNSQYSGSLNTSTANNAYSCYISRECIHFFD